MIEKLYCVAKNGLCGIQEYEVIRETEKSYFLKPPCIHKYVRKSQMNMVHVIFFAEKEDAEAFYSSVCHQKKTKAYGLAIEDICDVPAVDAVPVVRCKDCRYFSAEDIPSCTSTYGMTDPRPDDFCSYGERRNDHG